MEQDSVQLLDGLTREGAYLPVSLIMPDFSICAKGVPIWQAKRKTLEGGEGDDTWLCNVRICS